MGDPLSIAASVVGLTTISAQIVGMVKDLYDKVKDAPESMMRVREEVENMQLIFGQVQHLLNGTDSQLNRGNLTMISVHNLMHTLTGCVIVYSKLEKKVNEVCGFSDPTTARATWERVGVIVDQVKWGLWKQEEVSCIITDLQRQKLNLILMLSLISCSQSFEASQYKSRLEEQSKQTLESDHPHSVLLRELISRQEEQARALDEIRSDLSTPASSPAVSTRPADCLKPDNASIMSKRSNFSFRLGLPTYIEDLKASRAYKRLRHFGLGTDIDSNSHSVYSLESAFSVGAWSMLSDITLGDLSLSEIAVLNLPIELTDVWDPEPFKSLSLDSKTPRSSNRSRSSRGRIHNAIWTGNELVVKALLALGMDIEELDSKGRTPLVHATVKRKEAICRLLLERGASVDALKAFTSGMDLKERSELLDESIKAAIHDGVKSVALLKLLLILALGTTDEKTDTSPLSSQINVAIEMDYGLAFHGILKLELRQWCLHSALNFDQIELEWDSALGSGGWAPITHIAWLLCNPKVPMDVFELLDPICRAILENANIETIPKMDKARITVSMHDLVKSGYKSALQLLSLIESRDSRGWTPLASAAFNLNEPLCEFLVAKGCSLCLDNEQKQRLEPELSGRLQEASEHGHVAVLPLLLDMGVDINHRDKYGKIALFVAIRGCHRLCLNLLLERGADIMILSGSSNRNVLHYTAYHGSNSQIMQLILDNIPKNRKLAAVNATDRWGDTPLHDLRCAGTREYVELAKILVQAGALLTTKNNDGRTPYEQARHHGIKELARYLWSQLSPEQQAQEKPLPSSW